MSEQLLIRATARRMRLQEAQPKVHVRQLCNIDVELVLSHVSFTSWTRDVVLQIGAPRH
jgi:hypothetical protein